MSGQQTLQSPEIIPSLHLEHPVTNCELSTTIIRMDDCTDKLDEEEDDMRGISPAKRAPIENGLL